MNSPLISKFRVHRTLGLLSLAVLCGPQSYAEVSLATVVVGNPGNAPDATTGLGEVDYPYEISKYEITNAQFCEFANACMTDERYPSLKLVKSQPLTTISDGELEKIIDESSAGEKRRSGTFRLSPKTGCENHPLPFRIGYRGVRTRFRHVDERWHVIG